MVFTLLWKKIAFWANCFLGYEKGRWLGGLKDGQKDVLNSALVQHYSKTR